MVLVHWLTQFPVLLLSMVLSALSQISTLSWMVPPSESQPVIDINGLTLLV